MSLIAENLEAKGVVAVEDLNRFVVDNTAGTENI
jgi:hypothetical protein